MFNVRYTNFVVFLATFHLHIVRTEVIDNTLDSNGKTSAETSGFISVSSLPAVNGNVSYANATDIIVNMMNQKCSKVYSLTCFKLDLVHLVDRLGHFPSYQLLPGIALVHVYTSDDTVKELSVSMIQALAQGNVSNELENYLAMRINNYLNAFTLSVKLIDQNTVSKAQKLSADILNGFSKDVQEGRKKSNNSGTAMWVAGTLATLGMASLAALAGKALMTSMLALMLAAVGALKGGGGGSSGGGGSDKCAHHYITAHGRNMDIQELIQKPLDMSVYRTMYEREP